MTFSTTIFPRINFIKNFGDRLQQRIANGRVAMFFNRLVTGDASLDLDFASTKSLTDSVSGDNLITFTRASSATYVGSDGLIATAATNEPRFDHDPATGESLGLLIEEARTNLMLNSGTTAEMRPTGSTSRTSGGFAAPDGSTDASRVNLPEVTQPGRIEIVSEILGVSPNTDYTASIYLKGLNGGEVVYLTLASSVPTSSVTATLTTEWQRFDITGLSNSGVLYFNVGVDTRPGTGQSNQPAQSFYIWGAQIEYGSFPTSYIPTTSSAVTRAADVAEITGANFSSFHNASEGTLYSESKTAILQGNRVTAEMYDGGANRFVYNYRNGKFITVTSGSTVSNLDLGSGSGNFEKVAGTYKLNSFTAVKDGGSVLADNNGGVPSMISMAIGNDGGGISPLNGHIKRLAYFPTRLPDDELIELTV